MLAFVSYICMFLVLFQWEAVCLFSSIKVIIFLLLSIGSRAVKAHCEVFLKWVVQMGGADMKRQEWNTYSATGHAHTNTA